MKMIKILVASLFILASTNSFAKVYPPENQKDIANIKSTEDCQNKDSILIIGKDQFLLNNEINQSINKSQKKLKIHKISSNIKRIPRKTKNV